MMIIQISKAGWIVNADFFSSEPKPITKLGASPQLDCWNYYTIPYGSS